MRVSDAITGLNIEGGMDEEDTLNLLPADPEDSTLDNLPANKSLATETQVELMYLNGNKKNTRNLVTGVQEIESNNLNIFKKGNNLYLPKNTKILAKTANQII